MMTTTVAVAVTSAMRSCRPVLIFSQAETGAEKAASPTMPFRMPIDVMPIWTVERNLVGLSCRSIAACAPDSPLSTSTCSRALRLAVNAISDMANTAFNKMRKMTSAVSIRGAYESDQTMRSFPTKRVRVAEARDKSDRTIPV